MNLKFDKNKEFFQGMVSFTNGGVKPFVRVLSIKKDLISQAN